MPDDRRKFLKHAITGGIGIGVVGSTLNAHGAGITNEILVGDGGDYPDVLFALASITDASRDNPYVIRVLPGVFSLSFTTKSWVSILGSGRTATIFKGADLDKISVSGSHVTLSDFSINHTGSDQGHAAIERAGIASEVILFNIDIDHLGAGTAVKNANGDVRFTWWLSNLKIRTEGTALEIGLHTYCDNLKVLLHGDHSGHSHVGVKVVDDACRIYLNNCRIGTGYWWGYDELGLQENNVYGDDDLAAIWLPAGSKNARVEVHGLESFCRNETTTNPGVNTNVFRVEGSWLRAFGCFGQSETPMDWNLSKTVMQAQDGKVEQFACRLTSVEGNTIGANILPTQTFTHQDSFYEFAKFEGGLHRIDSSEGNVILMLAQHKKGQVPGEEHYFKMVKGGNSLILQLNGNTIEGTLTDPVLRGVYTSVRLIWDGEEWIYG